MPSSQTDQERFIEVISAEAEAVERFVDLLAREQKALASGDTEALPSLLDEKNNLAAHLESLASQRNGALQVQGFPANRTGMEAWCAKRPESKATTEIWPRIIAGAKEAQRLNRLNGELIGLRIRYNAQALEALRRGNSSLDLYGPNGQTTTQTNRQLNDAV